VGGVVVFVFCDGEGGRCEGDAGDVAFGEVGGEGGGVDVGGADLLEGLVGSAAYGDVGAIK
jgi:hypothetical protein